MLRVLLVRAAAGYPLRPLIPVSRDASGVPDHPRHVHEVPGHESRVPVGEVVLGTPGPGVEIRGTRAGLPDPSRVGLGRYGVTQVLEGVEYVHRAVLRPVLVARYEAPAHTPVIGILPRGVEIRRGGVEPLDDFGADRGFLSEPDGRAYDEDVGGFDLLV